MAIRKKRMKVTYPLISFTILSSLTSFNSLAADTADIAKKLQNPVADMISVPVQVNYDQNIGLNEQGERWLTNIQPVVPFDLNDDWNLISRTIIPVVNQDFGNFTESGIGDIVQSYFFSPKQTTDNGWIWGAGPVLMFPTASEPMFGTENWGIGPTAVVLKQDNGWTYGALANHIWGFGADKTKGETDVNATFIQPFIGYTWPSATSLFLNSETTIDWENDVESVPINLVATQVVKFGDNVFSIGGGLRYWAKSPDSAAEGLGVRLMVTWLIPQ